MSFIKKLFTRAHLRLSGEFKTRAQLEDWLERNGYNWRTASVTQPADRGATVHVSDAIGDAFIVRRAGHGYRLAQRHSPMTRQTVVVTR